MPYRPRLGEIHPWLIDAEKPDDQENVPPDGRALDRFEYPELFSLIEHAYGGSSHMFHIPDLMSRIDSNIPVVKGLDGEVKPMLEYLMRIK